MHTDIQKYKGYYIYTVYFDCHICDTKCFHMLFADYIEDPAESPALFTSISVVSPPTVEQEAYRKLGLTKQVLTAHTQKEEQAFLSRCKKLCHAQSLRRDCPPSMQRNRAQGEGMSHA